MTKSTINVAFICADYPDIPSGIGDYTYKLSQDLKVEGIKTCIITSRHDDIKKDGCLLAIKWNIFSIKPLLTFLNENKIDVVNIQYPAPLYGKYNLFPHLLSIIIKLSGYKVISTLHEFSNNNILRRLSMSVFIAVSDIVIMTTSYEATVVLQQFYLFRKALEKKIKIVPIGSNIDPCNRDDRELFSSRVISHFGIFYPSKGAERVVEIMEEIDRAFPGKYIYRFIGGTHPYYQDYFNEFREYARKKLERSEFIVNKAHKELADYICQSHIAVLGYNDGVSLRRGSFLAFLVNGIPIITNRGELSGDLKDIEGRGMYYSDNGLENITTIINTLDVYENYHRDHDNLLSFSRAFSFHSIARQYRKIIQKVMQ